MSHWNWTIRLGKIKNYIHTFCIWEPDVYDLMRKRAKPLKRGIDKPCTKSPVKHAKNMK